MKFSISNFCILVNIVVSFFATSEFTKAQSIRTDGSTPTQPVSCSGSCIIKGGLQQGNNLFHSFERFNVDLGATVLFQDSGVANIFSRVTGNELSKILGTLGVQGGNANLFLLNPNGIIFGPNSSLDVNGSFLATTADAIRFGEQGFLDTVPNDILLLTINPSALFFADGNNGVITNESIAPAGENLSGSDILGLRVPDGKSLLLVGGDVNLVGGRVNAFGGQIELGGLAQAGEIKLNFINVEDQSISLSFPDQLQRANVLLTNQAGIRVFSTEGGSITIYAENISISKQSLVLAGIGRNLGTDESQAGSITLDATNKLEVINGSAVANQVFLDVQGNGGDININSGSVFIGKKSFIQASTFGRGNAGNININVPNGAVIISTESDIETSVSPNGTGISGDIEIIAKEIFLKDSSAIDASTQGRGNAGNINISVEEGVTILSKSTILSTISPGAIGNGGNIRIKANTIFLDSGSQLVANVAPEGVFEATERYEVGGRGKGGNISLNVIDSVNIIGFGTDGLSSGIVTATEQGAEGRAGDISINTDSLRIADGAIVSSQTVNESRGGDIVINANSFEAVRGGQVVASADSSGNAGNINIKISENILLLGSDPNFANRLADFEGNVGDFEKNIGNEFPGNSGFFASVRPEASGAGGNIEVKTRRLSIQEDAEINVSATGTGAAGNLKVDTSSIFLDEGQLRANTVVGTGGNIFLDANNILLSNGNGSLISTNAESTTGGNIFIDTDTLIAQDNSDITANAQQGAGGRVEINAEGIFGIQAREQQTPKSDITATSELGVDFGGEVTLNTPDVDPTTGVVELPSTPIDAEALIAQTPCALNDGRIASGSSFTITGRGGLPPSADDPLVNTTRIVEWEPIERPTAQDEPQSSKPNSPVVLRDRPTPNRPPIQPIQGWVKAPGGTITLTASAPTVSPQNPGLTHPHCRASN